MPRYFFNINQFPDSIGSEHSDLASVRSEAVGSMNDSLRGSLLGNEDRSLWDMTVTDEAGALVFTMSLAATILGTTLPLATRLVTA